MYRLLFVDDDLLILKRLHTVLDWKSLGFDIMPDARDGVQALEIIELYKPHVVISDINMPNMDGLQLAKQVHQLDSQIQFVLLTVNDSFLCAQQAVNLGVFHYLLKPIEPKKLKNLILQVKQNLDSNEEKNVQDHTLQHKAYISDKMLRDKFLNWVVSGRQVLNESQLLEKFQFYNIALQGDSFQVITVRLDRLGEYLRETQNIDLLINSSLKCLENSLYEYNNCRIFSDANYHMNILLGFSSIDTFTHANTSLICTIIQDNLSFELNLASTLFVSQKHKGYQNIYRCYYENKYLLNLSTLDGTQSVYDYSVFMNSQLYQTVNWHELRQKILKHARGHDFSILKKEINSLFEQLQYGNSNYDVYYLARMDLITTGIIFVQENKVELPEIFHEKFNPLLEITEFQDFQESLTFIGSFYEKIIAYVRTKKVSSVTRLIESCTLLIEKNLSSTSLSVKWLSSQLYVHESYLSRQFHKEIGTPLSKYILNQRLETAKNYLNEGYTNLQTVSQMIGFSDALYFSKCFKKKYGVTPSKYYV